MKKKAKGIPLSAKEHEALDEYVGTVLAPKSLYPLAIFTTRSGFRAVSPDEKRYIGAGYFGDMDQSEECERQHMLPGLVDKDSAGKPMDKGQGLGTALYLGGNMVRAINVGSYEEACTYSLSNDRSTLASQAWASLVKHGLADERGESDYFEEEMEAGYHISKDDLAEYYMGDGYDDAEIDDISGYVTVSGTRTVAGNRMEWDTVRESGLILHLNTEDHTFEDENYSPPAPAAFAKIDWRHTPYSLFQDIIEQNAENMAEEAMLIAFSDGERWDDSRTRRAQKTKIARAYVSDIVQALMKARKRTLAAYAQNAIGGSDRPATKIRGPLIRTNPSEQRLMREYDKAWLADYTKGDWP